MPWVYSQTTGSLTRNGREVGSGYSGAGPGKNNPSAENLPDVGPAPRGRYTIGPAHPGPHTGPLTMDLTPVGHNALGRTLLRIHGDSATHPGSASVGCIILPPHVREQISSSGDNTLDVVL